MHDLDSAIRKASMIDGWMSEPELRWLGEQALSHSSIVELGCLRGRSSKMISEMTEGKLYSVDVWPDSGFYDNSPYFLTNLRESILRGKCIPIRATSQEAAMLFSSKGLKFDMVFIDADHSAEAVRADIEAYMPLLLPGGLLCGHDYGHFLEIGVTKMVDFLFPSRNIVPETSIWYIPK